MKKHQLLYLLSFALISPFLISCEDSIDKVNNPIPYEPVGGYETSDEVAAENLVSKISFDNTFTDAKSNVNSIDGSKAGFGTGIKGAAYQGSSTENRFAVGTGTTKVTGLNDFTLSFWLNSANTVPDGGSPGQGKGAQGLFSIVRPTEFWGALNVFLENPDSTKPNRLLLKLSTENGRAGVVWRGQNLVLEIDDLLNKWVHVSFTYNSKTSTITSYVNGVAKKSAVWFANDPGGADNPNNAPKWGVFEMTGTNGKILFGSHQFETTPPLNNGSDQPWATSFVGLMDEFRIYNKALEANEVTALYKLEKDNR